MTCLNVYFLEGRWYGSEIEWARSGSGFYRQTKLIEIPQSKSAIIEFAREHNYKIIWQGPIPEEQPEPAVRRGESSRSSFSTPICSSKDDRRRILAECHRPRVVFRAMNAPDFARLIDAKAAPLVLYARQWCDSPEDVVQEAFLKLVRQKRSPEDVVAWLYRVVRNGALDAAKIARRRQRRESVAARSTRWFVEPAVDDLDAGTAMAALERLVPEQREVLVAHLWGALSFEQIAAVVGCSTSTAFRRYTAGVEELRKQLGVTCPKPFSNG